MKNVFLAPEGYLEDAPNPFTRDGAYDRTWTIFIADPGVRGMLFQRKSSHGCYVVAATPEYEHFDDLMSDFLHYETGQGRKVIFVTDGHSHEKLAVLAPIPRNLFRPYDPRFLVHSTPLDAYAKILRDGMLKSPARLAREGASVEPIGLAPLGEPEDYLDYVMFAPGGVTPELVVNSRLCKNINCDPNAAYQPQARMYFDARRLIEDGRIVRDVGMKVYDGVQLAEYLVKTVTADMLAHPGGQGVWTPAAFSREADEYMSRQAE